MTKRQGGTDHQTLGDVKDIVRALLSRQPSIATGDVVERAGVTRQAVLYHLSEMLRTGEIARVGKGRGSRYVRVADLTLRRRLPGLEEDIVWREALARLPALQQVRPNVHSIIAYAFTEMLNNAIDHSQGTEVTIPFWSEGDRLSFEVVDDGVGVFRHVRRRFGLPQDLDGLELLLKGKHSTAPEAHSGEGIFFTSRAVDRFELESRGLRWVVDNTRADQAVGRAPPHEGTRVRCELRRDSLRELPDVFAAHTSDETLAFDVSGVTVRLFEREGDFVSRSEAKRLAVGLDRFREVRLDFAGLREVGQGFVDELFRVWARAHPDTRLVPVGASEPIHRMILRATAHEAG